MNIDKDVKDTILDILDIQCSDGNWNYDSYMHGMANGMILIASMLDCVELEFLEAPETWLCDEPDVEKVTISGEN